MAEKKRTAPDWEDLRAFLALGRHGTLSAAARALSVNHATISRRVLSLEATLDRKLVDRRVDGYALTSAGTQTLATVSDMEIAVQALGREASDGAPKGVVRINAPPGLAQGFLVRRLADLPIEFPGLDIDLATELRYVSLERRETDLAIRLDRPKDGDLIAKLLVTMGYAFYGTPAVCDRAEAGGNVSFIGFDEAHSHLPEAIWLARNFPQARLAFRANNQVSQATAASSGVGLALLPHYIGRAEEGLRICKLGVTPPQREVWMVTRRLGRRDLPVRTVAERIVRTFDTERASFEA